GTLRRLAATAFSFSHAGRDLRRCTPRSRVRRGRFGEFRSENRLIGCRWGSGRLTVEDGWPDQERLPRVFRSSLICSQSESYKSGNAAPELTHRLLKKTGYLFGLPLTSAQVPDSRHTRESVDISFQRPYHVPP